MEIENTRPHNNNQYESARKLLPSLRVKWVDMEARNRINNLGRFYTSLIVSRVLGKKIFRGEIWDKETDGKLVATWSIELSTKEDVLPPSN